MRLLQGDYERETAYDADPVDAAPRWAGEGAEFLHVVDLDGAKAGEPREPRRGAADRRRGRRARSRSAAACATPARVAAVLEAGRRARRDRHRGAARPRVPRPSCSTAHGDRVVVSVDARGGKVSLAGWTEASERDVAEAVAELAERGVERFLCTAIEVDGTMEGPALDELSRIAAATEAQVIASGGVGDLADLEALAGAQAAQRRGRDRRPGPLRAAVHRRRGARRPSALERSS